jgi:hypothetical protein
MYVTVLERRADQLGLKLPQLTTGYPHRAL